MTDSRLQVEGMGPLRAYVDGVEIDLGPPKQRATFAVLALNAGSTLSRAELVDRVWGETAPATAAGSLHSYLTGLRRALQPVQDRLVSDRSGYRLRLGREFFDVARLEDGHLAGQVPAQWTLFAGLPGPYLEQARTRLDRVRLQRLIEYAERVASPGAAVGHLLAEIPAHPLDERLRCVLMRALHHCGRTAEALAQYEDLRRGLAAELGISPSAAAQAGYASLLTASAPPAPTPPASPAAGSVLSRPAQLPHDNDAFVGRSEELLAVVQSSAAHGEPRRRIVMIVGVGGIGKTALAVRSGHMLRDSYPDGQVYLNLRGFDPSHAALTPEAALHQLLTSVGVPKVPTGLQERIALWRSLLADKRILLLLDNAKSADQVADLLPGGGACFVIVTSRNRLSGLAVRHAARRIPLGALTGEESMRLLSMAIGEQRVRAEPEAAGRLTELCDRLPFALQIAAEQVGSVTGARIGDLVAQLENVQDRLDALQLADDPLYSVRGVLSWSFAALDDESARAFRLLGVFPGTSLTGHSAAALFGTDVPGATMRLNRLNTLSLLEQEDDDRFTMHDLTRVYAAELSGELELGERVAALARVLAWYRVTLSTREGHGAVTRRTPIDPPRSDVPPIAMHDQRDCLRWCGAEWQNIVALVQAGNRHRQHGPAWHLSFLMFDYFYVVGQPLDWLDVLRVALRSAEAEGNRRARAMLLSHSSVAYSRLGQNDTAVRQLQRGLELLEHPDDWTYRISLLANLASTLREAKRYDEARGPAEEALLLARREGLDYYLAATHDVLCELNAETGRWAEALAEGPPGLKHARRARSRIFEANILINTGLARHGLGQPDLAEQTFVEALQVSQDAGDRYHEALALFGLARVQAPDGAPLARRALALFEELNAEEALEVRAFLAGAEI